MPIIANAKKALRQSKVRNIRNSIARAHVRAAIKRNSKLANPDTLSQLFSLIDKAVKKHIFHKNKAARIKSKAAKLVASSQSTTSSSTSKAASAKKTIKRATKKSAKN